MGVISHVVKPGHRCKRPAFITTPASYIKAGDVLGMGEWNLYWNERAKAYQVFSENQYVRYEFHNLNCAAAKLVELGA